MAPTAIAIDLDQSHRRLASSTGVELPGTTLVPRPSYTRLTIPARRSPRRGTTRRLKNGGPPDREMLHERRRVGFRGHEMRAFTWPKPRIFSGIRWQGRPRARWFWRVSLPGSHRAAPRSRRSAAARACARPSSRRCRTACRAGPCPASRRNTGSIQAPKRILRGSPVALSRARAAAGRVEFELAVAPRTARGAPSRRAGLGVEPRHLVLVLVGDQLDSSARPLRRGPSLPVRLRGLRQPSPLRRSAV